MESEENAHEPHLVLAHKVFLLTHPDVQDIEKFSLCDEVFVAVKVDNMALLYETLAGNLVLDMNQSVLDMMIAKIDEELKKLDEK